MKKWISLICAMLIVAAFVCIPVQAAELNYVTDAAGLLTDWEWEELEYTAQEISQQYECDVYIMALDDFTEYSDTYDAYEAAKDLYIRYDLGYGPEKSGVMLMLSMAERDYALIAYGYGNTAFTDYGKEKLTEVFLDDFGRDDWYGGFRDYLSKCGSMLASARDGVPLDRGTDPGIIFVGLLISVALSCLIALIVCCILESKMRSVRPQTEADAYLRTGSLHFTSRDDRFTHMTTHRVKREKSSRRSGGTTVDSDGFSGSSGKF